MHVLDTNRERRGCGVQEDPFFSLFFFISYVLRHDLADDGRKTQGGGSGIRWVAKKRMEGEVVSFSFEVKDVTRREEILYIRAVCSAYI